MGRLKTIARRTFLVGSLAVAGGVAFGVYQHMRRLPNPLQPGAGETSLNPYLIIAQDGVTIIAPRAEMGQGIHSTLAAMVAEELDVAWEDVRVIHGPAAQAYFNGALIGLGMPFRDYAETSFQTGLKETAGLVAKMIGLQVTGGSTSTIDGFDKMRMAGAAARETLKAAAAEQLGVETADLSTENGAVIAPDGSALPYAQLAEAAAARTPPSNITLRPASEWKYLGQDMPRHDQLPKATGTAEFGADILLPGMKFATVRMNPNLEAAMTSFDDSAARAMPGVEEVIALEGGVAVVASNTWLAMQAADAIEIEWEQASYPADMDGLWAAIEAGFEIEPNSTLRDDGDVDIALRKQGERVRAEYRVPWLAHATMEPMNATALFSGDALEIWTGNQAPLLIRDKCAEATGLEPDAVTVHTPYLGGGFGRRSEFDVARLAAIIAQQMSDVPIKLSWSREEDMRHDFYRPAAIARFEGVVKDGEAQALKGAVSAPSVSHLSTLRMTGFVPPGPDKGHVEGLYDQPYAIPNYRIDGHLAELNVPIGFWRSVGASFNGFFMESFIDEMAVAAGRDPLEFRIEMAAREHAPTADVLRRVGEMSGWTGETAAGLGRGVAMSYTFGTPTAQVIELREDGGEIHIAKAWIACDVGLALDPRNIRAQMSSALIYGLSAAIHGEITFADGQVEQGNFPDYDAIRMSNCPEIEVEILEANKHMGGVGEPGLPPTAPALTNAIFDLTGQRCRELPLGKQLSFAS